MALFKSWSRQKPVQNRWESRRNKAAANSSQEWGLLDKHAHRIGEQFAEPIHFKRELVNFGYARYDNRVNEYEIRTLKLTEADVRANGHLQRQAKD